MFQSRFLLFQEVVEEDEEAVLVLVVLEVQMLNASSPGLRVHQEGLL